ncbi:hypothetical protein ACVWWO_007439 [Bradyrhizobium sp. F1.13.1]
MLQETGEYDAKRDWAKQLDFGRARRMAQWQEGASLKIRQQQMSSQLTV